MPKKYWKTQFKKIPKNKKNPKNKRRSYKHVVQQMLEPELLESQRQRVVTDDGRARLAERLGRRVRQGVEQLARAEEVQHAVAQDLQQLVVLALGRAQAHVQRLLGVEGVGEAVADGGLEFGDVFAHQRTVSGFRFFWVFN